MGPTTVLIVGMNTAQTTMDVRHNQMASGDMAYLEGAGKVEFIFINSAPSAITGGFRYTVVRNQDGTGANSWDAGGAVFNTGAAGDGFMDIYSVRGVKAASEVGPTIVGNVRNSATYNDWSEFWAIGNLNGVYGYGTTTYGLGLGKFNSGDNHLTIDVTNGIRFFEGTATLIAQWSGTTITLGQSTLENIQISTSSVALRDGSTIYTELKAGVVTLGRTTLDHVRITSSGIEMKDGSVIRGQWQTDGDIFIGSNIANAADTYFAIFANAQTYNGEVVSAGDMLIGDNSTGPDKANIFWDKSTGKFQFRGGKTMQLEIDTDGTLLAGVGTRLDSSGLTLNTVPTSETFNPPYSIKFESGSTTYGSLWTWFTGVSFASMYLETREVAGVSTRLNLLAHAPTNFAADVGLEALSGTSGVGLSLQARVGGTNRIFIFGPPTTFEGLWLSGTVGGGVLSLNEQVSPPSTAVAFNYLTMYADSADKKLYVVDDAGLVTSLFPSSAATFVSVDIDGALVWNGATGPINIPGGNQPILRLPNSGVPIIDFTISVSEEWSGKTIHIVFWWSPNNTNTGNARLLIDGRYTDDGITAPGGVNIGASTSTAGTGTVNKWREVDATLGSAGAFSGYRSYGFRLYRDANSGADTFTGIVQIGGIYVYAV